MARSIQVRSEDRLGYASPQKSDRDLDLAETNTGGHVVVLASIPEAIRFSKKLRAQYRGLPSISH